MGVVALALSGLYFLDLAGAVAVDGTVTLVTVWIGLAGVMAARSVVQLRQRLSG
jgi:hypothetical protein